jgi:hypothetical protein
MNQLPVDDRCDTPNNGMFYGSLTGLLLGAVATAPQLNQWPLGEILLACGLSSLFVAVLWHCAIAAARAPYRRENSHRQASYADPVDAVDALQDMDWADD